MREGVDHNTVGYADPRPENDMRLDHHVAPDCRVMAEEHRLGRRQSGARRHHVAAFAALKLGLGRGELDAVVDALHLAFGSGDRFGNETAPPGQATASGR